jgi:YgiT-type zinc finger domain-containing protein
MQCLHCNGLLRPDRINYSINRHGYHLIIDDLPAWVCQQCGEPLFDEKTVDVIQAILQDLDDRMATLETVPLAA